MFKEKFKKIAVTLLSFSILIGGISPCVFAKDECVAKLIEEMSPSFERFNRNKRIALLMNCIFTEGLVNSKKRTSMSSGKIESDIAATKKCLEKTISALGCLYNHVIEGSLDEKHEHLLMEACFYIGVSYRYLIKSKGLFTYYLSNHSKEEPWKFLYYNGMMSFFDENEIENTYNFCEHPLDSFWRIYDLVIYMQSVVEQLCIIWNII